MRQYPLTAKVLDEHTSAVVNVDDPRADPAEVATLRTGGDRSLLMLPLVYRGEAIGLLEASDARRARSYSRQELRLCQAVAGQAAVALHNAWLRAASRSGRDDLDGLRAALRGLARRSRRARRGTEGGANALGAALERLAGAACDVLGADSCVSSTRGGRPGPRGPPGRAPRPHRRGPRPAGEATVRRPWPGRRPMP